MVKQTAAPQMLTVSALGQYLKETCGYDLFADAPPVDVDAIAKLLDITVIDSPTFHGPSSIQVREDTIGLITLEADGEPIVWINSRQNSYEPRRRFTLAHEIGHFCMHRVDGKVEFVDDKSTMSRSESYWTRHESEANNFAAELLMPTSLIHAVGRKIVDIYKRENNSATMPFDRFSAMMAPRFRVSNPAMEYRLKNMGIGRSEGR
jgi:Zn-dependent peptidase ImmA (M78 family)